MGDDLRSKPATESPSHPDLLRRALITIGGRGAVLVASFGFAVATARVLDPAARGNFALLQSLNGISIVAANFAIQGAIVHYVGRRGMTFQRALGAGLSLGLLSGLLGTLIVTPAAILLRDQLFQTMELSLVFAAIVLSAPLLVREYLGGTMIAAGRPLSYVVSHAAQPLGGLFMLLLLSASGAASLGDVAVSWAFGIFLSAGVLVITGIALFKRPRSSKSDLRGLVSFGLRTYPAILARFLNLRLDQFLVAALATHAALGIYAVAVNIGELLVQIPVALLWGVSGAISASNRATSQRVVEQFCRWAIVIMVTAGLLVALAAPSVLPLVFGPAYRDAVPVVFWLLPGMICYAPALIITEYFIVQRGAPSRSFIIAGASIVTGVLGNFGLTQQLGAVGAGIASSIAYAAMLTTAVILYSRDSGSSPARLLMISARDIRTVLRLRGELRNGSHD